MSIQGGGHEHSIVSVLPIMSRTLYCQCAIHHVMQELVQLQVPINCLRTFLIIGTAWYVECMEQVCQPSWTDWAIKSEV